MLSSNNMAMPNLQELTFQSMSVDVPFKKKPMGKSNPRGKAGCTTASEYKVAALTEETTKLEQETTALKQEIVSNRFQMASMMAQIEQLERMVQSTRTEATESTETQSTQPNKRRNTFSDNSNFVPTAKTNEVKVRIMISQHTTMKSSKSYSMTVKAPQGTKLAKHLFLQLESPSASTSSDSTIYLFGGDSFVNDNDIEELVNRKQYGIVDFIDSNSARFYQKKEVEKEDLQPFAFGKDLVQPLSLDTEASMEEAPFFNRSTVRFYIHDGVNPVDSITTFGRVALHKGEGKTTWERTHFKLLYATSDEATPILKQLTWHDVMFNICNNPDPEEDLDNVRLQDRPSIPCSDTVA